MGTWATFSGLAAAALIGVAVIAYDQSKTSRPSSPAPLSASEYERLCADASDAAFEKHCEGRSLQDQGVITDLDDPLEIEVGERRFDLKLKRGTPSDVAKGDLVAFAATIEDRDGWAHDLTDGMITARLKSAAEVAAEAEAARQATCPYNWRACVDDQSVVSDSSQVLHARGKCKRAAEAAAKYGDPDWPWSVFDKYVKTGDILKTGKVTLVETEAKFRNGFNALVKVYIECDVDLTSTTILGVRVQQ